MTEKHKLESCDQLKGNNWSAENFIKHVTSMTWHLNPELVHMTLVNGYPVLTPVNWP